MGIDLLWLGIDLLQFHSDHLHPWVHFSTHAKMYLGVNLL